MTINVQSAGGATVPDTKLARDATELMREAASNLTYLRSRPVPRWGSPPGHGVPEDSIRRVWSAIALPTAPGIPEFTEPEVALVTARVELPGRDAFVLRLHLPWAAALLLEMVADAVLAWEAEGLPGEASEPAPPPDEPAWRGEPLTQSETRVLRYLPTHMGTPEIAAELYISANTVRTHQRHLYRKLGAHTRHEAVQHARALGLLPGSSAGHRTQAAR